MPNLKAPWALAGTVDPCCCTCPDAADLTLTTGDILICPCIPDPFGSYISFTSPLAVNGVVTVSGGPIWFFTIPNGAPFKVYSDAGCTVEATSFDGDLVFEVQCSAGTFTVSIYVTNLFTPGGFLSIFTGTGFLSSPITNDQTICGAAGVSGYEGTALVEL